MSWFWRIQSIQRPKRKEGTRTQQTDRSEKLIAITERLEEIVGPGNVVGPESKDALDYLKDMGDYPSEPLVIVQPNSTEEVSKIVEYARKTKTPIVARGAGTSLTGASSSHGGIVIDFSKRMKRILKIDTVNWYVHCEPGIALDDLNDELRKKGFFFPPDPSSAPWCTVGGAVAENSGGMKCFRYGTVKDWTLALEVVLSDGSVAKFGEALPKNRTGYDLVHLVCGSEGTLAIITEAWLKIIPLPDQNKARKRLLVFFEEWGHAGESVQTMRSSRIQPTLLEFIDGESMTALNDAFDLGIPLHEATLFIETDSQVEEILSICKEKGSTGSYLAKDEADEERLYNARALVYLGVKSLASAFHTEDVVVPLDKLIEYLEFIKKISKKYGLRIPTGGHAGDGNIHPVILFEKDSKESCQAAEKAFSDICNYAIEVGGSVSGEHGIGEQKIPYAEKQLSEHSGKSALELMKQIKRQWDPDNILNPSKFLDV
ncbi:MAG: FAD-binding oxidoreductase [Nitrososphaerales archaeon]